MTEVVTSFAAAQQLNLLADRQQVFGVSTPETPQTTPTNKSNALQAVLAAADKTEGDGADTGDVTRDATPSGTTSGPSRPRIEIKQFDVGLSPSEVVGTADVLQRFDNNGDGRVDLLESDRAALVRQKVFTFAGLAAAPRTAPSQDLGASVAAAALPALTEQEAPVLAREVGVALATLDETGLPRKFSEAAAQIPGVRKFHAAAEVAAVGGPAGEIDAPKKYYGQGVEVVAGQVANNGASPPAKYYDRVPVKHGSAVIEEGTGEIKYYDRVPQAETPDGDGDPSAKGGSYHDKAQELAAAMQKAAPVVAAYAQTLSGASTEPAAPVVTA